MPHDLDPVQPGDLITAEYFNDLVAELAALEARIIALELSSGGGSLAILGRIPGGPYRIGDELQVIGRNFEYTSGAARVFLNATPVIQFDDTASSNERLVFNIPAVSGVEEEGTEVELRVLNSTQSVSETIILRPRIGELFGDVDVEWQSVNPTTIEAGGPATFEFRVQSRASETALFTLTPTVTVDENQSLWQERLQVLGPDGGPLPDGRLELVPLPDGSPRTFNVRISEVPAGTEGTNFGLEVVATADGVTGTSGMVPFQVGEETELPDPNISLNPLFSIPPSALDLGTLTLTAGLNQQVTVHFSSAFTLAAGEAASYNVTLEPSASTTGWNPSLVTSPVLNAPPSAASIQFTVRPTMGASDTGELTLRVRRQGADTSATRTLSLVLS